MNAFASSLIDWNALGRIALTASLAGGGVVVVFGLMLLGLERAQATKSRHRRLANWVLAGACGVCCIGALLIGIYAMTDKPSPKHASKAKSAALAPPARLAGS
jgi:NADH:ubiquinone oxidoreductase subunit 6 (subunit J)